MLEIKDGKALVVSKYDIDCQPYERAYTGATWETCSLRGWLNDEFLNTAFAKTEQAMIPTVMVSADKNPEYDTNPGNATQDKVVLLSIDEVNRYYDSARCCEATAYAEAQGAYEYSFCCWWWLRSPGSDRYSAAGVDVGGFFDYGGDGVYNGDVAVRPAMWIDLTLL